MFTLERVHERQSLSTSAEWSFIDGNNTMMEECSFPIARPTFIGSYWLLSDENFSNFCERPLFGSISTSYLVFQARFTSIINKYSWIVNLCRVCVYTYVYVVHRRKERSTWGFEIKIPFILPAPFLIFHLTRKVWLYRERAAATEWVTDHVS